MFSRTRLRTAGMALSHAVFFTIALLPAKPSLAQQMRCSRAKPMSRGSPARSPAPAAR